MQTTIDLKSAQWRRTWMARPWHMKAISEPNGTVEVNGVRGFLTFQDVAFLFNAAGDLPRGGTYVEIGSWLGLSAIAVATGLLANVNVRARIFAVDTWCGSMEHKHIAEIRDGTAFDICTRNLDSAGVLDFVTLVRGDSAQAASAWRDGPIDMLFVDGDHSFDGCILDLRSWYPHLATGAVVLGHDAAPSTGVVDAVHTFCRETGLRAAVLEPPHAHYIWQILRGGQEVKPGWRML